MSLSYAAASLVRYGVKYALGQNEHLASSAIAALREVWPQIADYDQRQIIVTIEVAIALSDRAPIVLKDEWLQARNDLRGPKSHFTVDYRCNKCWRGFLKLWRGVHGCKDENGHELLCAACLAPGVSVGVDGRAKRKNAVDDDDLTDQINGWLPAVPTGDTYWGYTSVPSQDLDWWIALPTYRPAQ